MTIPFKVGVKPKKISFIPMGGKCEDCGKKCGRQSRRCQECHRKILKSGKVGKGFW